SIEDSEKAEKPKPHLPCGDDIARKPRFGYDLDIDHSLLVEISATNLRFYQVL
ncbi:hypothetical protein HDU76_002531, partial [Blyttiomyces sp. JEL0837]